MAYGYDTATLTRNRQRILSRAYVLWLAKNDTSEIARILNIEECEAYNMLATLREMRPRRA